MALGDLHIVDVSGNVASSYATKLYADHGATVTNLEPAAGFSTRKLAPLLPDSGDSAMHGYLHANNRSVALAPEHLLSHPTLSQADLIVYCPELLADGISIQALRNIGTNTCAISWYGSTGPYADFQGSDATIHALTGLMRTIGEADGPPVIPPGQQAQIVGGLSAFNGTLSYLLGQRMGNRNECFHLDASILEANMCITDLLAINAYNENPVAPRMGVNRFPPTYPLGIWPCKDGWLGVTTLSPSQWQAFCKLLELDEFAEIELFQSSINRLEASDMLEPIILAALSQYSAEDLFYRGQAMRIPLARVPTMDELFNVDQYAKRRAFSEINGQSQSYLAPSTPFRLLKTPPHFGGPVAALGEHNLHLS